MSPHPSLSLVPDILAVRTDISHRNSRMHGLPKVRTLQDNRIIFGQEIICTIIYDLDDNVLTRVNSTYTSS